MDEKKQYTPEQLADAETLAKRLASLPESERKTANLVISAYIDGMQAAKTGSIETQDPVLEKR